MDLKDLEVFIRLAKYSSLSEAAERLHIAQSALSKRLSRLEHRLGVKLMLRHARGIELSKEGQRLASKGGQILEELQMLRYELNNLSNEPAGLVKIGMTSAVGQFLPSRLISIASEKYPNVSYAFSESSNDGVSQSLKEGAIDIGVFYSEQKKTGFNSKIIMKEPLLLVGSPEKIAALKIGEGRASIDIIRNLPMIISQSQSLDRIVGGVHDKREGQIMQVKVTAGTAMTKGMVAAGLGFSLLPYPAIYNEIQSHSLLAVEIEPTVFWYIHVASRINQINWPALSVTKEMIADQVPMLIETGHWRGSAVL